MDSKKMLRAGAEWNGEGQQAAAGVGSDGDPTCRGQAAAVESFV
jgi:hypothetical protein